MRAAWIAALALLAAEGGMPEPTVKEVSVETADGQNLAADLYEPGGGGEGKPAVLALPDAGGSRKDWKRAGEILSAHGVSLLALDLRKGAEGQAPDDPALWKARSADVEAGLKHLRATLMADGKKLGLAGAGAGAGLALTAMEKDERVRAFLGVAPSPAACGQAGLASAVRWNGRPAGIVVGRADEKGDASALAKALAKQPRAEVVLVPLDAKTSASALLALESGAGEAAQFLCGWLTRPVFTGKPDGGVQRGGGIFVAGSSSGAGSCAGGVTFHGYLAPGLITSVVVLADPDHGAKKLTPASRRITVAPAKAGKEPALSVTVDAWTGTAWKKDRSFTALDAGLFVVEGKTTFYEVWLSPSTLGAAPFAKVSVESAVVVDGSPKWPEGRGGFSEKNPSTWQEWELR